MGILSHWECGDRVPESPSWGLLATDGTLKNDFGNWSLTSLCAAIVSSYFPLMCGHAVKVSRSISKISGGYTAVVREQRKFLLALLGSSQDAQTSAAAAGLWESKGRDVYPSPPSIPIRHGPKKPSQLQMQTFGYSCLHLLMPLLSHHHHRDDPAKVCLGQIRRRRVL